MKKVPLSTMERLPAYLRVIDSLVSHGVDFASSAQLASRAGVSSAQFRKDMSLLGASSGVRGAGYDLAALRVEFRQALGSAELVRFVIVGAGNLGQALAASSAFRRGGLDLAGIFDVADGRVGQEVAGISVLHDDQLEEFISANEVSIAVIATPGSAAQQVADTVVRGGAQEILNFSPVVLQVPSTVEVRSIDLGVELQMLALHARNGA